MFVSVTIMLISHYDIFHKEKTLAEVTPRIGVRPNY